MAKFKIHAFDKTGKSHVIHYNNMTSSMTMEDGTSVVPVKPSEFRVAKAVSATEPGRKGDIKTLKVSLGLSCNYACTYCSQRFVPHADSTTPDDIDNFIQMLTENIKAPPERVEFWGGEPLVYWKTLKPLAEKLRAKYPDASFGIITNGSLLDEEKNQWLDRLGFSVGISHDGPGQHVRGPDPFDDPSSWSAIKSLYDRLRPQDRISINTMMHAGNQSRAEVQAWMEQRFGGDITIGEGSFVDPYDEGGLASMIPDGTQTMEYRRRALLDLRTGGASKFDVAHQKIKGFIDSIVEARPAAALGQKCGMDKSSNIAVDLNGNVLTCQNVSAVATAPNGKPHKIGHISDLDSVALRTSTHWSNREECSNCPVLQLCHGSCMFLEDELWDAGCDSSFSDNVPFFAAAVEAMTGLTPVYIEGPQRSDRRDLFGFFEPVVDKPKRTVIPIVAT